MGTDGHAHKDEEVVQAKVSDLSEETEVIVTQQTVVEI